MASVHPVYINSLPLEILSSIFVTLVGASLYARSVGDSSYGSKEYPTLLSSVCAHWRRVSISTPYLWSYIELVSRNTRLRNVEHLRLWLERSQNAPLRLRLGKGGKRSEDSPMVFYGSSGDLDKRLASVLRSSAPQVYSFTFRFNNPGFAANVLACLLPADGQRPIRELALLQSSWAQRSRSKILPQNKWDQLFEALHVLRLERWPIDLSTIPCCNLAELRIIYPSSLPSLVDFVHLLESNPGLHTLEFSVFSSPVIPSSSMVHSIKLPSLRNINFSMNPQFVAWFFGLLVPESHELNLRLACREALAPNDIRLKETMLSFFRQTRIRSLYLQPGGLLLPPILASLSHLQTLGISSSTFGAGTLIGLEPTTNLLPNLHTIDLHECLFDDYSALHPGLCILFSLPSMRRIRHMKCGNWDRPGSRERFIQLLAKGDFGATIIQASGSDFEECVSPFQ